MHRKSTCLRLRARARGRGLKAARQAGQRGGASGFPFDWYTAVCHSLTQAEIVPEDFVTFSPSRLAERLDLGEGTKLRGGFEPLLAVTNVRHRSKHALLFQKIKPKHWVN